MPSHQEPSLNGPVATLYKRLVEYEQQVLMTQRAKNNPVLSPVIWSYFGFSLCAVIGIVLAIKATAYSVEYYISVILSEFFLLGAIASLLILAPLGAIELAKIIPEAWRHFRDPLRLIKLWSTLDDDDFRFASELRDTFPTETLEYLAKRLTLRVAQLRDNYGLIIGAPSNLKFFTAILVFVVQVGFFRPLLVQPFIRDNGIMIAVLSGMFLLFTVVGIADQAASQRIEKLAQVLELAAKSKEK